MSKENVIAFRAKAESSPEIQKKVTAASAERAFEGIIDLANEHGFSFTREELFSVINGVELSPYELDLVSGGITRTVTAGDCGTPALHTPEQLANIAAIARANGQGAP